MQEQEVEVSFCDLCGTSVPAGDIESKQAVIHEGKVIGQCCLATLRGAAEPAAKAGGEQTPGQPGGVGQSGGPSGGQPAAQAGAGQVGAGQVGAGQAGADGSRLMTVAIVLLAALAGGIIFLDSRISRIEDAWATAQSDNDTRQKADSEALLGVAVKLDGMASGEDLQGLRDKNAELATQLASIEDAAGKRQAVLEQEIDGLRRALRAAEGKIVDYRPLFEDLRQRHSRAIAAIEGMRDRVAAVPASVTPTPEPATPTPSKPTGDLPADLAEQVENLAAADPAVRFEAVDVLIESQNLKVLPHLLPLAKDPDAFVRRLTVEGLREFQKAEAVDALVEALRDEDENVCDTAWRSLRDLTGQKFPFDASANKESRARAAQKWADWWSKARDSFGS